MSLLKLVVLNILFLILELTFMHFHMREDIYRLCPLPSDHPTVVVAQFHNQLNFNNLGFSMHSTLWRLWIIDPRSDP
jgi:hypothetical protein